MASDSYCHAIRSQPRGLSRKLACASSASFDSGRSISDSRRLSQSFAALDVAATPRKSVPLTGRVAPDSSKLSQHPAGMPRKPLPYGRGSESNRVHQRQDRSRTPSAGGFTMAPNLAITAPANSTAIFELIGRVTPKRTGAAIAIGAIETAGYGQPQHNHFRVVCGRFAAGAWHDCRLMSSTPSKRCSAVCLSLSRASRNRISTAAYPISYFG